MKSDQRIQIILADLTHTGMGIVSDPFPLAVGYVGAYAIQELGDEIEVTLHKFPQRFTQELEARRPTILGFSSYNWNANLTYRMAAFARRRHPGVVTVFGGPDFPLPVDERKEFLAARPAIDFFVKLDGEHAFTNLYKALRERSFDVAALKREKLLIGNICYLTSDGEYIEGPDQRIMDLMTVPSPYTMGLMDKFFDDALTPSIETTRGCPYSCTFCVDGTPQRSLIAHKSPEYVRAELEYIAARAKHSPVLNFCDLNFGMYKHDIHTAEVIRDIRKKYGWPGRMYGSTGKAQPDRIAQVARIINEGGARVIKIGSSLQSLSTSVLKAIKRKNLPLDVLREMNRQDVSDVTSFTEFIIPLPEETRASFYAGLAEILDDSAFSGIAIHNLTMLMGSVMATREERAKAGFVTRYRMFPGCVGSYTIGDETLVIAEEEETVVSTRTMTVEEYLEVRLSTLIVKIFLDADLFQEVLGMLRKVGAGCSEVLKVIQFELLDEHPGLASVARRYLNAAQSKLFDTSADLAAAIARLDPADFESSPLIQNELLVHRSLAYREQGPELLVVLRKAAEVVLRRKGLWRPIMARYLDEAVELCGMRRFDFKDMSEHTATFGFDFVRAQQLKYLVDPEQIQGETEVRCYYDAKDLPYLEQCKDISKDRSGNFIRKTNWAETKRKIAYRSPVPSAVGAEH